MEFWPGSRRRALDEQHGGLRRVPVAQEDAAALEQRVGLALVVEGRLTPDDAVHAGPYRAQLGGDALHRLETDGHELVELEAELGAARDGLAVDAAREGALAEALAHRLEP